MLSFLFYLTITLFILVCVFMILLILIQKGRGGGLASAFGGAGGNTAFGSKTGDVLTWATSIVFGIFLLFAVGANLLANKIHAARTGTPPATAVLPPPSQPNPANPASPLSNLPKPPTPESPPPNPVMPTTNSAPADLPPKTGGGQ